MKTLYVRIALTFVLIAFVSALLGLLGVNLYYQSHIRNYNENKIRHAAEEIRALYERMPGLEAADYFRHIASLGFQLYAVKADGQKSFYGAPFRRTELDPGVAARVLEGGEYDGIVEEPHRFSVIGLFENSLRNSVGLPFEANGERYALFVRPDLEQQLGEVRIVVGLLIGLTFAFSIAFIFLFTRYIVKPVKQLTAATRKVVEGDYNITLDVARSDEIGNMARHFMTMSESLQKLDDMRQAFVANVSHEIQSPLTSIQGFAQAAREDGVTDEERGRYLTIIEEESRRLSLLGKQLLTLAALDKDSGTVRKTSFRLDEQIRQVVLVIEWQLREKGITVELELPEAVITADKQLLHQVWLNLIANAVKFSDPGGTVYVELDVQRDIAVTLQDTGVGIPEAELPYIFDRFYKADKSRNRNRSGSGLGLSIVHKIVQVHGGTVEAQSRLGEGTTFTVRLPSG
ncbi:sensor histidine kinase [Paenibacillus sp. MBLB4367]|uniref:sensor histidine kinase n=1 Tax=Paenibacillus sp. MBLB4367 TaxID=3384767 RepID=UPI003907EA94